jgi:hypothetical protein
MPGIDRINKGRKKEKKNKEEEYNFTSNMIRDCL